MGLMGQGSTGQELFRIAEGFEATEWPSRCPAPERVQNPAGHGDRGGRLPTRAGSAAPETDCLPALELSPSEGSRRAKRHRDA